MNQTADYELSILVPVFNEEENMNRLEKELASYTKEALLKTCIIYINDGSTDKSLDYIKEICSRNTNMFYLSLSRNMGLSAAMKAGIDFTFSKYVGYIDADLQTAPADFNLLIPHLQQHELVMGIRAMRQDSIIKKLSSKVGNGFRRMMTGDDIKDTGCPLKIIHTDYAKRIPFFTGMHRFLPALIMLQEAQIKQVPVSHFPRIAGKSKYHMFNRMIGPFKDCFAYRWMKHRYIHYTVQDHQI
ncbi:MAG TPA: dolichol-phosphate mannosyltransferase [Porphyromonadaceae bacterium]|nr:dolichol-phosphate mannosyltransferase [Porphyromonadaceae bacterium]